jgi:hypothetical protein
MFREGRRSAVNEKLRRLLKSLFTVRKNNASRVLLAQWIVNPKDGGDIFLRKKSAVFQRTTGLYIPDDRTLHSSPYSRFLS